MTPVSHLKALVPFSFPVLNSCFKEYRSQKLLRSYLCLPIKVILYEAGFFTSAGPISKGKLLFILAYSQSSLCLCISSLPFDVYLFFRMGSLRGGSVVTITTTTRTQALAPSGCSKSHVGLLPCTCLRRKAMQAD